MGLSFYLVSLQTAHQSRGVSTYSYSAERPLVDKVGWGQRDLLEQVSCPASVISVRGCLMCKLGFWQETDVHRQSS